MDAQGLIEMLRQQGGEQLVPLMSGLEDILAGSRALDYLDEVDMNTGLMLEMILDALDDPTRLDVLSALTQDVIAASPPGGRKVSSRRSNRVSISRKEIPSCCFTSVSVRTRQNIQSHWSA